MDGVGTKAGAGARAGARAGAAAVGKAAGVGAGAGAGAGAGGKPSETRAPGFPVPADLSVDLRLLFIVSFGLPRSPTSRVKTVICCMNASSVVMTDGKNAYLRSAVQHTRQASKPCCKQPLHSHQIIKVSVTPETSTYRQQIDSRVSPSVYQINISPPRIKNQEPSTYSHQEVGQAIPGLCSRTASSRVS